MKTPVLFIIFNRLDTTKQIFEQIKKAKPPKLYIACDGPRENKPEEAEKVKKVREYVLNNIDWDCEVKTLFREKNLGCRINVSSAITWFFENEKQGIVLEDDTLPVDSFFQYCEVLLEKYRNDERVGIISGFNAVSDKVKCNYSYFFSVYNPCWGWATWRDRWEKYDVKMRDYPLWLKSGGLNNLFNDWIVRNYWYEIFNLFYLGINNTSWDAQLTYTCFKNNWLTVVPVKNQILNIGFNYPDAVHCKGKEPKYIKNSKPQDLEFPLKHPMKVESFKDFDYQVGKIYFGINLKNVAKFKIKRYLNTLPLIKEFSLYDKVKGIYYRFK